MCNVKLEARNKRTGFVFESAFNIMCHKSAIIVAKSRIRRVNGQISGLVRPKTSQGVVREEHSVAAAENDAGH